MGRAWSVDLACRGVGGCYSFDATLGATMAFDDLRVSPGTHAWGCR